MTVACNKSSIGACVDKVFKKKFGKTFPDDTPLAKFVKGDVAASVDLITLCHQAGCTTAEPVDALPYSITTVGDLKKFLLWWCKKPSML